MTFEICIGVAFLLVWAGVCYFVFDILAEERAKNWMGREWLTLFSYKKANEEFAEWMAQNEARLARRLAHAADELGYDCSRADLFGNNLAHEIVDEWARAVVKEGGNV